MDYPKSVPNVGLVGGKFVDENTATGQVGSLIPSAWGTAVTDEIINVIKEGGFAPKENENNQLTAAIKEIIKKGTVSSNNDTAVVGKISDVNSARFVNGNPDTTDLPAGVAYFSGIRAKYNGGKLGFDFGCSMTGRRSFGRLTLADGTGDWFEYLTTANFSPSDYMPKNGGAFYPKFSGLSFNAEAGGYNVIGGYIGWGSNGSGTVQFICNKGGGSTGGFLFAHSDAAGNLTNAMRYTPDGRLAIAAELYVPAIVSNTLVNTQGAGYAGKYIASCEFVNNAVRTKIDGDRCVQLGFYGGVTTAPFMLHSDGTVVYLQTSRPKDTALLTPNGWSKNADTGEIKQWVEVIVDDISSTKTLSVSWPFQFPNKFLNAQITFKIPSSTGWCTAVGTYYDANASGCMLRVEEWASVLQTGMIAVIEARGN